MMRSRLALRTPVHTQMTPNRGSRDAQEEEAAAAAAAAAAAEEEEEEEGAATTMKHPCTYASQYR